MSQKFEDAIKEGIRNYARSRAGLPRLIANTSVNHFKDNWRKQGFDDATVHPWEPRKNRDSGRAILVKSGRLRRSFSYVHTQTRITIINDAPYGFYHNEGTKRLPQRKFMGESENLNKKNSRIINGMIKGALK